VVHSAGGGGEGGVLGHVGKFEGVDNANAIRDLMVDRCGRIGIRAWVKHGHAQEARPLEPVEEARMCSPRVRALGAVAARRR
jgi:hypothetical protein